MRPLIPPAMILPVVLLLPLAACGVAGGMAGTGAGGAVALAAPPPAQPFCTRSLGVVDCWPSAAEQPLPARPGVADGPQPLAGAAARARVPGGAPVAADDPPGH